MVGHWKNWAWYLVRTLTVMCLSLSHAVRDRDSPAVTYVVRVGNVNKQKNITADAE